MGAVAVLIGREAETAVLGGALAAAAAGTGSIVLVTGEAGIGKTALLEQYLARARTAGLSTAWETVPEAEGAPPYWPWRSLLQDLDTGEAAGALVAAADALTASDRPEGAADQVRFRAFDQVARALRAIGAPVLLILDDLHRADGGTLRLLEFLAPSLRRSPVVLVVASRPAASGSDLAGVFGALIHAGAQRIDLRPWSRAEVGIVLRQFEIPATEQAVERVQRATGGNPFFVREVARAARASGAPLDLTRLPATVIDVLGAEARRLDALPLDLLRLAAAWGQGAPVDLVAAAAGQTAAAAARSLPADFLTADAHGALWFRHDLVQEAVYHGVPEHERAALHARLADAVERSSRPPEACVRHLAVHGCRAGPAWKPDVAFAAALAAAEDARTMNAIESAAAYLELAEGVRRWCSPDAARDLRFLVAYGDALTRTGDGGRSGPILAEAAALARASGDTRTLARIALIVGLGTETAGTADPEARRLIDEALAGLPPDEHALRSRLLARGAWQALSASDGARLVACAEAAVAEARISGDPGTIAQALSARFISTNNEDTALRRQMVHEIIAQATRANDVDLLFGGLLWEAHLEMEAGAIHAARRAARRYRETAEQWPLPYHAWYRWILDAALAFLDGRLDDADAAVEQLDPATTSQSEYAALLLATQRLELAARRGDRAGFESAASDTLSRLEGSPVFHAVRAHMDACLGRHDAAAFSLDLFIGDLEHGPRDNDWLAGLVEAALAAIRLGAVFQAALLFERIEPYRGLWGVIANATVSRGPVTAVLARLARLIGDADSAAALETEAEAEARRAGTPGALFWAHGGPRWPKSGAAATGVAAGAGPAGLSGREREVLALLAAGCSNQEIADRLVLSIRTVQRHVENIYAKTGARGRAAASVFAATHGIVAPGS